MIRHTVHFSGHVQGVGFRYTARNAALGHSVAGYVQNLDDGRVLVVVEGKEEEVSALVREVAEALSQFIRGQTTDRSPATGEFGQPRPGGLSIRY